MTKSRAAPRALAWVFAFSAWLAAPVSAQDPPSGDEGVPGSAHTMAFLIGTWHVTERIYPGTDREYVESSVRVCTAEVMETYVFCKTLANGRGRQREYWFLVNQPDGEGSIEMVGLGSNYTAKSVYRGQFLGDGSGIDLRSYGLEDGTFTAGTYQRMRFRSADEFVWTIGITNPGSPDESVIGIERAVRVSPASPD